MTLERLTHLTPDQIRRRRRLSLEVLWVCTIFLLPWSVYLLFALPHKYNAQHYDLAWSGFDVMELLALGATAYYGWRRRQAMIGTALAAATLLVCDAWFDVSLSLGTPDVWCALASAVFVELPLALFLILRIRLLIRVTMLQIFPETDEKGRAMRLLKVPLIPTILDPLTRLQLVPDEPDTATGSGSDGGSRDAAESGDAEG